MKIITFSFAGGNMFSFNNFFPFNYNFSILEYPGRLLIKENLIENRGKLINDLLSQFKREINSYDGYIIYGYSMGALIGYLICKKIEKIKFKETI